MIYPTPKITILPWIHSNENLNLFLARQRSRTKSMIKPTCSSLCRKLWRKHSWWICWSAPEGCTPTRRTGRNWPAQWQSSDRGYTAGELSLHTCTLSSPPRSRVQLVHTCTTRGWAKLPWAALFHIVKRRETTQTQPFCSTTNSQLTNSVNTTGMYQWLGILVVFVAAGFALVLGLQLTSPPLTHLVKSRRNNQQCKGIPPGK